MPKSRHAQTGNAQGLQRQAATPGVQESSTYSPSKQALQAAAFYKLHCELTDPDFKHSLLANALSASSTGAVTLAPP